MNGNALNQNCILIRMARNDANRLTRKRGQPGADQTSMFSLFLFLFLFFALGQLLGFFGKQTFACNAARNRPRDKRSDQTRRQQQWPPVG